MVLELLALRAVMAHEGATGEHEVRPGIIKRLIYEEILLFPAEVGMHMLDLLVKITADLACCMAERRRRADERGLVIQCLACIGHKDGRDTEGIADEEDRR